MFFFFLVFQVGQCMSHKKKKNITSIQPESTWCRCHITQPQTGTVSERASKPELQQLMVCATILSRGEASRAQMCGRGMESTGGLASDGRALDALICEACRGVGEMQACVCGHACKPSDP